MRSLHDQDICDTYASWAKTLWGRWRAGYNGVDALHYRTRYLKRCMRGIFNRMALPYNNLRVDVINGPHEGSTDIEDLKIEIIGPINDDDIMLNNFIEIFHTAYHELRHLEQYYRVVQGVNLDIIPWPDKYFINGRLIRKPRTGIEYSQRIAWNAGFCQHAINNATLGTYNGFSNSRQLNPPCGKYEKTQNRPNDNWTRIMKAFLYDESSTFKQFMYDEGVRDTAKHIIDRIGYRESTADQDAFAIENFCKNRLQAKWHPYNQNDTPP